MRRQTSDKELDPYERKVLKLLDEKSQLKFGEIIMRLGLSANHGQRVLGSLVDKKLVEHGGGSKYMTSEDR
jgi:DNA-binding IclR family transcriptional regulator